MSGAEIDWNRIQKALDIELSRGCMNIQGNQYLFHEFLVVSLQKPPTVLPPNILQEWRAIAQKFILYPQMDITSRQYLIQTTQNVLLLAEDYLKKPSYNTPSDQTNKVTESIIIPGVNLNNAHKTKQKTADQDQNYSLDQKLTYVKGIGPKSANILAKLELLTVRDLLNYFPRDHLDYAQQVNICDLQAGETVTIIGKIKSCHCFTSQKNSKLTILEIVVTDRTGRLKISRFFAGSRFAGKPWQMQQQNIYKVGALLAASGLVKQTKYGKNLENPELEILDREDTPIESIKIGKILPVYPLIDGVGADVVRKCMLACLPYTKAIQEYLPEGLLTKYQLIGLAEAINNIHFPTDQTALDFARRRLIFDELFFLQLGLLKRRSQQKKNQVSAILPTSGELIQQFTNILPFALTNAQNRVVNEILNDLAKPEPMNRLVQGDVGAGKTVVAVIAMLAAIQAGYQAAIMAPTEVLAEQHYHKLVGWLNLMHLPVELLTGSTKTAKRRTIHQQLSTGELPVLVGTHALIQDSVIFHKLGLVVIDEQHRFGVAQRAKLQQKGESPHVLTMTATPIPRTLALTIHGDLDVSQIDELPPGRQAIQTTVLSAKERIDAYELMRREIVQGRQIYVVLPLVEESEKLDLKSAVEEHQRLATKVFPEFQVGLLHGRMNSAEKEEVITQFRNNELQILVSTTVIEVGVDVPNATVMMIENAERFGLSQLHQLRGRVGRGSHRSYCLLLLASNSDQAMQRLRVLEQSQDGFFIAEMDLRLRGPGQVLGMKQSGLPDFALASLVDDQDVLEMARQASQRVIEIDENLERWPVLQQELERRYVKIMGGSILT